MKNFREYILEMNEGVDKKLLKKVEDFAFDAETEGFEEFDKWARKNLSKELNELDPPEQPENMTNKELKKAIKDLKIK